MTQKTEAAAGRITPEVEWAAKLEGVSPETIRQGVVGGTIVICRNLHRKEVPPLCVGKGLKVKVNANIGSSRDDSCLELELEKLKVAVEAGADTVMDLSTGGDLDHIRREIIKESPVAVGTVPLYQVVADAVADGREPWKITEDEIFEVIDRQGEQGVDYITVHCGVNLRSLERLKNEGRILDVVSRGGSLTIEWMVRNGRDNPLFNEYDRLLEIAARHEMTLSLGDGMRPGCLADATDRPQIEELITLGEVAQRAWKAGVQVMIEGPGHVPLNRIQVNMELQKELCHGAPFYVLGPLVTDIGAGYDHITAAIGGAVAAMHGADFLCYVTPSEHLGLPGVKEVREGVIGARIAAHAGDIAKGLPGAIDQDIEMSRKRKAMDWEGQISCALDPVRAREIRDAKPPADGEVCTMCSELCAIKTVNAALGVESD